MVILGIDPGLERMGYGVIRRVGSQMEVIEYGLLHTPKGPIQDRLLLLHKGVRELIQNHRPDAFATEKLFFAVNKTTAMDVAKALGVALLAAGEASLEIAEYSPPEIKLGVVGTGSADKKQVQFMVTKLLGLKETPKPDDVADALAVAICHAFKSRVPMQRS